MRLRVAPLIVTLALGILLAPLAAEAQQPGKVYRVGYLSSGTREAVEHVVQEFERALSRLGWVQGQNLVIEFKWAEGRIERFPDLAAELVRLKVDVIVAPVTMAALAAKRATGSIPVVMVVFADPVGTGLVASLARPGRNITGLSLLGWELAAKQLELLKEAVPKVSRVAVLWHSPHDWGLLARELLPPARALGVKLLQPLEVRGPNDLERAFAEMAREGVGAFLVMPDPLFLFQRERIVDLAAKRRLPAIYYDRELVEAGGLMAYGPNLVDLHRRAAAYVDKILKGAKPADLPVEQPTKFELVINLKTAKALGLTIPPSVLVRADQVIE